MKTSLLTRINKLLGFSTLPTLSAEEVQQLFTSKYRCFRELLTANNNALEAMAALETVLQDGRTFSMGFVRSKSTVVTVNIYKMVQNLRILADGGYANLETSFTRIQQAIDATIDKQITLPQGDWIIPIERVDRRSAALTGEKMANLGEAGSLAGILIPPGFCITSAASRQFYLANNLYREINRLFQQTDARDMEDMLLTSREVQQLIQASPLPSELEEQLYQAFDQLMDTLGETYTVAVRSSALGEDLSRASFAGLYHTELSVARKDLISAYKTVLASKYSPQAMSYRLTKGFRHEDIVMCVGCLAMIPAAISGICYSQSLSGQPGTLDIFFADGLAKGIVDGTKGTTHALVERQPPYQLADTNNGQPKHTQLSQEQSATLAAISLQLEAHFGSPQDIEWSIDAAGKIYVLQSRPISVRLFAAEAEASPRVADDCVLLQGGVPGCRGVGAGPVAIVRTQKDMIHFPRQAVLVVEHPLPEWAPLLKRAAALVTETGSEAGHLATLSREFGLPALLALDNVTTLLQNGETVTVDASNRTIYRGRIEALLEPASGNKRINPMEGSPVQQILRDVLQHITPLTLTDPESVYFRASRCATMHDITRFCHEKSVVEMFDFGRRYRFAKGAAKRLVDNMPLEWWVINLSDGFSPDFDAAAAFINISDITSAPMLALWQGMHAFPWQGPPSVSVRGMGAIVFQSAMNPTLDPAVASKLNQKNYFLVSRNYCNLSVRLGYHYAMIEAYISSLRTERYVTFRFKGGAADESRRMGRIQLLEEILTRFSFRVERTGDALTARVEKRTRRFLFSHLQVLGYLTIHTRQIDMVMADARECQRYRHKFIAEIEEMLGDDKGTKFST